MRHFLGIDPGLKGAFALTNETGKFLRVYEMPLDRGRAATGSYAPKDILKILRECTMLPNLTVGIEWPNTRPGEGAQRSRNFGLGLAYIEMALIALKADYRKVDPQKWMNRLGLQGKLHDPGLKLRMKLVDTYYPYARSLITGVRGGLKDGPMEAILIAEYLRRKTLGGMKGTVARFGKGSVEAMALVLGAGRRKRK